MILRTLISGQRLGRRPQHLPITGRRGANKRDKEITSSHLRSSTRLVAVYARFES